jgi:DNA-binding SARP family transcriptional activator
MEFRILGPVELRSDGQRRALESGKVSGILAALLLTPGKIIPADDLIDRLWETSPPAGARGYLSVYVSRLRAALRRAGGNGAMLAGRAGGYVLDFDPDEADLHQFRRLRRQGAAAASASRNSEAVRLLRDADRRWRGPALAGISGEWFAAIRHGLQEERRAAVIERVQLELDLGRHVSLVGELASLLARYPMDEILIACQMTALYRCGRMSEALSLFRETRHRLAEDQCTEPGSALVELHQRILRQDSHLLGSSAQITFPGNSPAYCPSDAGQKSALIRSSSGRPRASLAGHHDADAARISFGRAMGKFQCVDVPDAATALARLRAARQAPDRSAHLAPADPPVASAACAISRARRMQRRRNRTVNRAGASS